jgi:hypothetical protein
VAVLKAFVFTETELLSEFEQYAKKSSARVIWRHWLLYKHRQVERDKQRLLAIMNQERAAEEKRIKMLIRRTSKPMKEKKSPLIKPSPAKVISVQPLDAGNSQGNVIFKDFKVDTFELHSAQIPFNRED